LPFPTTLTPIALLLDVICPSNAIFHECDVSDEEFLDYDEDKNEDEDDNSKESDTSLRGEENI